MVAFGHRDDRGVRSFLSLVGVEARFILLESPRCVLDPSVGGFGGGGEGGSLCPQREDHSLMLGGRQVQRLLVCCCMGLFHTFLNLLEEGQHHLGFDVGGEAISDWG